MTANNEFDSLEDKIEAAKKSSVINPQLKNQQNDPSQNSGSGMRTGMEFVVSIVVSVFIGIWLDKTFDTKPLFFIALFFLGVITGFVNIWRMTNNVGSAIGYKNLHDEHNKVNTDTDSHTQDTKGKE